MIVRCVSVIVLRPGLSVEGALALPALAQPSSSSGSAGRATRSRCIVQCALSWLVTQPEGKTRNSGRDRIMSEWNGNEE